MARITQEKARKGSQKWLQSMVNTNQQALGDLLRPGLRLSPDDSIEWLSPLESDGFAEYRDGSFVERLSIRLEKWGLSSFWPRGGPVWDGLARTSRGDIILVEAKSHISEMVSSCKAKEPSLSLIKRSLDAASNHYKTKTSADWPSGYYQFANRLAHLYLLRHLNGIPAWLVFVCFVNDHEMSGPKSVTEWQAAMAEVHRQLGIERKLLHPYVVDVYPDVEKLGLHK